MKRPAVWKMAAVIAGLAMAVCIAINLSGRPPNPRYFSKPVGQWFDDLCTGVWGGTPKGTPYLPAAHAFAQIDSNAVPYLVSQLQYDRSGLLGKWHLRLRKYSMGRWVVSDMIFPTERRNYAAVALKLMGRQTEPAVPALFESWEHDNADVKLNAMMALESILLGRTTTQANAKQMAELQSEVMAELARRYPALAPRVPPAGGTSPK